jgi:peptidoglycan hydrolase-like protein with peptidoglycan-binding domain
MTRQPAGFRWDCGSLLYGSCPPGSPYTSLSMAVTPGPQSSGPAAGGSVRAAQGELARLGYKPGPVDGVIGPRTSGALRAFQRAQQLPETGSLTPETLGRLRVAG